MCILLAIMKKNDEPHYILNSSFINIFYLRIKSHDSALSNRFYNSLIYRRPMIVTKGGIQGYYATKYGVGIAVDNADEVLPCIAKWNRSVDFKVYDDNCRQLLKSFIKD